MVTHYLSRDEEAALLEQARAGDVEARNRIVMNCYRLICLHAHRFAKSGVPVDDLVQHGVEACLRYFDKFDPSKGVRTNTYFGTVAYCRMLSMTREWGIIKQPRQIDTEAQVEKMQRTRQQIPLEDVVWGEQTALGSREYPPEEWAAQGELAARVRGALRFLDERSRRIVMGRVNGEPLRAIAERYRVSLPRVRQIATGAKAKLKEKLMGSDEAAALVRAKRLKALAKLEKRMEKAWDQHETTGDRKYWGRFVEMEQVEKALRAELGYTVEVSA